ncbi:MAG: CvpA family protein [Planctomycetota bacterium]|jgi:hypothetical protein
MFVAFNVLIILLVLLIAYWWGNQGVFSAIIHLLCVITAGAVALAVWEPLTAGMLLRGGFFDSYAWGVSLVGVFVVTLFILRLATNRLVPANVDLPHWANVAFGFPVGAAAGVLTVGMLILGAGFIQSQRDVLGFAGMVRSSRDGQVKELQRLWLPCHKLTDEFYSWLSVTSLSTRRPLRHFSPNLYQQAGSLIRDSAKSGRGAVALPPSEATVEAAYVCPDLGRCALQVKFRRGAIDFGEQLSVSSAQVRLIARAQGREKPYVSFPVRWSQEITEGGIRTFQFDDVSHYITSIPGRESADVMIEFPLPAGLEPRFVQIKGTRYETPRAEPLTREGWGQILAGQVAAPRAALPADSAGARPLNPEDIRLSNSISPVHVSTNTLPGTMKEQDKLLIEGDAIFRQTRQRFSRALLIKGIAEPPGTRLVQVNVGRSSTANIYGPVRDRAGEGATPALVDDRGHQYTPIGYIHENPEGVRIKLEPSRGIRSITDLPHLPTAGDQKLRLLFRVTDGVTIVGFRLGDVTVGTCNLAVVGIRTRDEATRSG